MEPFGTNLTSLSLFLSVFLKVFFDMLIVTGAESEVLANAINSGCSDDHSKLHSTLGVCQHVSLCNLEMALRQIPEVTIIGNAGSLAVSTSRTPEGLSCLMYVVFALRLEILDLTYLLLTANHY